MNILSSVQQDIDFQWQQKKDLAPTADRYTALKTSDNVTCVSIEPDLQSKLISTCIEHTNKAFTIDVEAAKNVCVVNTSFSDNYGHCLHDVIPILMYIDKHSSYDVVYTCDSPFLRNLLNMYGINFNRVKFVDKKVYIKPQALCIENWPAFHYREKHKIWSFKECVDLFLSKHSSTINNRLIYCTRNNSTDVMHGRLMNQDNEDTIISKLKEFATNNNMIFTMFNGQKNGATMSHLEQAILFSEAKIVVGPHGSAMANIIYLSTTNDCKVCEFTSGTEVNVHGGTFVKHYNNLYGYLFEDFIDYYLVPFTLQSTSTETYIDTNNLDHFLVKAV